MAPSHRSAIIHHHTAALVGPRGVNGCDDVEIPRAVRALPYLAISNSTRP